MTADRQVGAQDHLGKDATASTVQNAALRGASLAFGKPPIKPKPKINTYSGNNGALAAATKVGGHPRTVSNSISTSRLDAPADDQRLAYQSTGGSTASRQNTGYAEYNTPRQRVGHSDGGNGLLQLPAAEKEGRSPSLIAATLAASRSASISPNPTGPTGPQQLSPANMARLAGLANRSSSPARSVSSSRDSSDHPLDTTPIPPTTSLIDMFEKTGASPKIRPQVRRSIT